MGITHVGYCIGFGIPSTVSLFFSESGEMVLSPEEAAFIADGLYNSPREEDHKTAHDIRAAITRIERVVVVNSQTEKFWRSDGQES